jgi:hypothetical protein
MENPATEIVLIRMLMRPFTIGVIREFDTSKFSSGIVIGNGILTSNKHFN